MIVLEKPTITDLFVPRSSGCEGAIKKGCFNRKDIMTILSNYITVESATTILDQIFLEYIQGDNNLTELILNAVGDVYTKEQVDAMVENLQEQIDELGGGVDESVFEAYTAATETRIAELERRLDDFLNQNG